MPKKPTRYYSDDYESDPDLHTVTTLISRNTAPVKAKKKEGSNKKKKEKAKKNTKATPRNRAQSAPPSRSGRTGHDLWMTAVKNRETASLTHRHPESPRHKSTTEYWVDTLRRTGTGITTQSTGSVGTTNTFTRLRRPNEAAMAYLSTSSYMRQMMGTEKNKKYSDPTAKPPSGTPAYRSQEEYYEQVLELKKQIKSLNQEISVLRAKARRTEEDNIKKEKEIEGLLDPTKNEEMRRTMGEKRAESGAVIQSLKQKILKLENQIRDKEANYAKLHADLKTTKVEEMKVQLEMCYQEIVRLQNMKDTGMTNHARTPTKENSAKIRALNETILRINKQNEELQLEIKDLREDLNREMEGKKFSGDYEDMNKKQLLCVVNNLEKRLEKMKKSGGDHDSLQSYDSKVDKKRRPSSATAGKIELSGSLEDRLDQLDKRETELLGELEKSKKQVKRLKDEKTENRQRMEEYEKLINDLQAEIDYLNDRQGKGTPRRGLPTRACAPRQQSPRNSRPPSGRKYSVDSTSSEDRRRRRQEQEQEERIENFTRQRAAKKLQKEWKSHRQGAKEREEKVEDFRRNRAAKTIQNRWTGYKYQKHEEEVDEAAELIGSALRGHSTRKNRMKRYMTDYDDYDDDDDSEGYSNAVDLIQSSVKGHYNRRTKLKTYRDDDESPVRNTLPNGRRASRPSSAVSRTSFGSKKNSGFGERPSSRGSHRAHESYDDDDDIQF
ncbi:IQ domain-containing protein E-like isoform X4 [Crassostrea angulata]|uniref:IQ domain-containing protein E-like isoform X4 n=1 Tax=Magallana angulata TaxID=2784310 RepID=UPI0022B0CD07|nr:IQ domain-containing protein E-like isoform X4 [Crassostrea angulata]